MTIRIRANNHLLRGLKNKIDLDRMSDAGRGMQDLADGTVLVCAVQLAGVKVQNLGRGTNRNQG